MRRLLLIGFLLALPAVASAQETWSIGPVPAAGVTKTSIGLIDENRQTCKRLSTVPMNPTPALNCTQAQACVAAAASGGASCTPAQARAANARIFPVTQAGREEFISFAVIIPAIDKRLAESGSHHQSDWCEWFLSQSQTTQDARCAEAGLPAACQICK